MLKRIFYTFFFVLLLLFVFSLSFNSSYLGVNAISRFCVGVKALLSYLTSAVPFSLFEGCIFFFPLIAVISYRFREKLFTKRTALLLLFTVLTLYFVNVFVPTRSVEKYKRNIDSLNGENASHAATLLCERINQLCENGFSDREIEASPCENVKKTLFSPIYSALGISGAYYFMTGEPVINTDLPPYLSCFTSLHECAHSLGYMREDEATLYAYASLSVSDNPYHRYSAALSAYEMVAKALYGIDKEAYNKIHTSLAEYAKNDIQLHRDYRNKNGDSIFKQASEALSDKAIELRDGRGLSSYSESAVILVDYITAHEPNISLRIICNEHIKERKNEQIHN